MDTFIYLLKNLRELLSEKLIYVVSNIEHNTKEKFVELENKRVKNGCVQLISAIFKNKRQRSFLGLFAV
jgi:hypothetical protein